MISGLLEHIIFIDHQKMNQTWTLLLKLKNMTTASPKLFMGLQGRIDLWKLLKHQYRTQVLSVDVSGPWLDSKHVTLEEKDCSKCMKIMIHIIQNIWNEFRAYSKPIISIILLYGLQRLLSVDFHLIMGQYWAPKRISPDSQSRAPEPDPKFHVFF